MTELLLRTWSNRSSRSSYNDWPYTQKPSHNHHYKQPSYYAACYAAGACSSSIRWILTPLDVVKVRMQTVGATSRSETVWQSYRAVRQSHGYTGLFRGLSPTAVAYGLQTSIKYGTYEVLKDTTNSSSTATTCTDTNKSNTTASSYLLAAATAELIADVFMCPFETIKVKMQTDPTFPRTILPALRLLLETQGTLFASLVPIVCRQVPSTCVNFVVFEQAASFLYEHAAGWLSKVENKNNNNNKENYTLSQQLGVTVAAGYAAGICSSIVSHPADSIVSLMGTTKKSASPLQIFRQYGMRQLLFKGLGPRIVVNSNIISFQWLLYNGCKASMGFSTTGGH